MPACLEISIFTSDNCYLVSWLFSCPPNFWVPRVYQILWPSQLASISVMPSYVRIHPYFLSLWPCTKLRSIMNDQNHVPIPCPWFVLLDEWPYLESDKSITTELISYCCCSKLPQTGWLTTIHFITLQFWRTVTWKCLTGLKSRYWQSGIPSGSSKKEPTTLLFQSLEDA